MTLENKLKKIAIVSTAVAAPIIYSGLAHSDKENVEEPVAYKVSKDTADYTKNISTQTIQEPVVEDKKELELREKIEQAPALENYYKLADYLMQKQDVDEAIVTLSIAASEFPKNDELYVKLGDMINKPSEAVKKYAKAIEINADNGDAYYGIGKNLWMLKQKERALFFLNHGAKTGHKRCLELYNTLKLRLKYEP